MSESQIETLKGRINESKNQEQILQNQLKDLNDKLVQANELHIEIEVNKILQLQ